MIPRYEVLSRSEVETIHNAGLEILESVGLKVESRAAREVLRRAGARVEDEETVKIPSGLVDKALEDCRPSFSVYHRNSDKEVVIGAGETKYSPTGWTADLLDWRTGEYRTANLADMVEAVRLCDSLDQIDSFMAPYICADVPPGTEELYQYKVGVEHSDKPIIVSISDRPTLEKVARLGAVLAGGEAGLAERPNIIVNHGLLSPLYLPSEVCEIIFGCAELKIPLFLYTSSTAGGTSPVTMAGTLAGNHAETLGAVVLAKLVNPEIDIIYSNYAKSFDMRQTDVLAGNPEFGLFKAAAIQLGEFIGLPTSAGMLYSDSPRVDIQSGLERVGGSFLTMLSRPGVGVGMGMLAKLMVFSLESLVIDAETVSYFNRILGGFGIDEERLAVEAYQQAGPGGEFMTSRHTFKHFREELWYSDLYNRSSFSAWSAKGRTDTMRGRVRERIETILNDHQSPGVSREFEKEFEKIIG